MYDVRTLGTLKSLGLTEYEAKVYMALNLIKAGTASDIHAASNVPRSAIYSALARLDERGLVEVDQGKPMRYRSIVPAKAMEKLRSSIDAECGRAQKLLEEAHARGESREHVECVWTVRSVMNLYNKISDLLNDAEGSIILIATDPMYFDLRERFPIFGNLASIIKKRLASGVRGRIVCVDASIARRLQEEFPDIEVRFLEPGKPSSRISLTGGVVMVDDREVLINITDGLKHGDRDITAIHTRVDSIVSVLRHFIEVEWDAALPVKPPAGHE